MCLSLRSPFRCVFMNVMLGFLCKWSNQVTNDISLSLGSVRVMTRKKLAWCPESWERKLFLNHRFFKETTRTWRTARTAVHISRQDKRLYVQDDASSSSSLGVLRVLYTQDCHTETSSKCKKNFSASSASFSVSLRVYTRRMLSQTDDLISSLCLLFDIILTSLVS